MMATSVPGFCTQQEVERKASLKIQEFPPQPREDVKMWRTSLTRMLLDAHCCFLFPFKSDVHKSGRGKSGWRTNKKALRTEEENNMSWLRVKKVNKNNVEFHVLFLYPFSLYSLRSPKPIKEIENTPIMYIWTSICGQWIFMLVGLDHKQWNLITMKFRLGHYEPTTNLPC